MRRLLALAGLLVAPPAAAVDIEYVAVRDAGNPAGTAINRLDAAPDCRSVPCDYAISELGVANAHYVSGWLEGLRAS
jgi:hypothetical protein